MKAEEQTMLNETLVKVFKFTEEQVSKLYNEDGDLTDLTIVAEADAKRVARFNTEKQQQLDRGIKEGATKVEKAVKDKYAVESDLIGVELIDSIVVTQVEEATKATNKDISKHAEYIKLESSINSRLKERDKEWEDKLKVQEAEFNKTVIFDKVKSKALSFLESSKAILPSDVKKAENWKTTYVNELKGYSYMENEDGTFTVLNKEGQTLRDSHENPRTFDEVIKESADKYFDYPVAENRSGSGNQQSTILPVAGEPRTKAEALAKLKEPSITPENRKKYSELMDTLKD